MLDDNSVMGDLHSGRRKSERQTPVAQVDLRLGQSVAQDRVHGVVAHLEPDSPTVPELGRHTFGYAGEQPRYLLLADHTLLDRRSWHRRGGGFEHCCGRVNLIQIPLIDVWSAQVVRPPRGGELAAGTSCVRRDHVEVSPGSLLVSAVKSASSW
ncbi:hypothetical protein [Nonomuraea jabiensis]|uniref:hypothetical protein n=1 Tax=Nonomuraea jabiensis TaxID=882448 RepID=UPI0036A4C93D